MQPPEPPAVVPAPDGSAVRRAGYGDLIGRLAAIRGDLLRLTGEAEDALRALPPARRPSARNLLHYLALRRHDLRPLQEQLMRLGLSSLGRAEPHVLATLDAVTHRLHEAAGCPWHAPAAGLGIEAGRRLVEKHAAALFGPAPPGRRARIMVTLPGEAAVDYALVHDLLRQGMNVARINCAHDDPVRWEQMIAHVRRAEAATHRPCRVLMDLAGPKLRTGPLAPGPAVVRIRPRRDALGRVERPARVWLTAREAPSAPLSPADACLPVARHWLTRLAAGARIRFTDGRGAPRLLTVLDVSPDGAWAEAAKTAYVTDATRLRIRRGKGRGARARVGPLPPVAGVIPLDRGDLLVLDRTIDAGRMATRDAWGQVLSPAVVGCTLPEVFDDVRTGERILFDDGKIEGVVETVEQARLLVRITRTRPGGGRLRGEKGINLPDSTLHLPAMTAKDAEDLAFVAAHADLVALSFANDAADVRRLRAQLDALGGRRPGIVLKVETRRGFEHLPAMLLEALKEPACGVMIARGDLAVECGFERLAEVQEEILWLCEAAHVPAIWATQVLESLARDGLPSRAEVTDAAMGHRAECVMLNKGAHVVEAVRALDDILRRMEGHQDKKRPMLRELHLASTFRMG